MDNLEIAKMFFGKTVSESAKSNTSTNTHTVTGTARSNSDSGYVMVDMGGDTVTYDNTQAVKIATTVSVKSGQTVIINLMGTDGTGKTPLVIGVVGGGDATDKKIDAVSKNADSAKTAADSASLVAKTAKTAADEAKATADATGQHFWDDDNGAHVSTSAGSTSSGGASTWNSNGMIIQKDGATIASLTGSGVNFYDSSGNIIASYNSSGVQVGKSSNVHLSIGSSDFKVEDASGNTLSKFNDTSASLGANSTDSLIKMCGGKGSLNYYKDSLNNGHVNLSNNGDASTQQSNVEISATHGEKKGVIGIGASGSSVYAYATADNITVSSLDGAKRATFTPADLRDAVSLHPVVLYSDDSGTTGTITLSKSAANYTHMRIYYRDDGGRCGTQEVYIPNGKTISLSVLSGDSGQFFANHGAFTINGTTITPDSTYYGTFIHISSTDMGTHLDKLTMNHVISITRVEAWGEIG